MSPGELNEEEREKEESTRPKDWPGIPGRSREHERTAGEGGDAEVTREQRALEEEEEAARSRRE